MKAACWSIGALVVIVGSLLLPAASADDHVNEHEQFFENQFNESWSNVRQESECDSWDTVDYAAGSAGQDVQPITNDGRELTHNAFEFAEENTFPVLVPAVHQAAFLYGPGQAIILENGNKTVHWLNCAIVVHVVIPVGNTVLWTNEPVACYVRDANNCGMDHTFNCADPWAVWIGDAGVWAFEFGWSLVPIFGEPTGPMPSTPTTSCFIPPGEPNCVPDPIACVPPTEWCTPPEYELPIQDPPESL